ncbi:MAG: hypothetical protein ABI577_08645 [bacterium]
MRDRVYGDATRSSEGRRSIVVALLTISVFLLVFSVSCRQITAPEPARNVIEAGLVTLTDLDQMIADDGPELRQAALESQAQAITIPGYPLDIVLTRDEVLKSSDQQLRGLILERSSALLYADGVDAFDRTGDRKIRRLSLQGLLELEVGQLSDSNYSRATFLSVIAILGCAVFGAMTAANGQGWGRMRSLGFAAAAGAVPVILLFLLLKLVVGAVGGSDPFEDALRDVTDATVTVPIRNGIIVLIGGAVIVAAALVLGRLDRDSSEAKFGEDY